MRQRAVAAALWSVVDLDQRRDFESCDFLKRLTCNLLLHNQLRVRQHGEPHHIILSLVYSEVAGSVPTKNFASY
jgi:hypothetical protein